MFVLKYQKMAILLAFYSETFGISKTQKIQHFNMILADFGKHNLNTLQSIFMDLKRYTHHVFLKAQGNE